MVFARVLGLVSHGGSTLVNNDEQFDTTKFDYLFEDIVDNADKHLPATDPGTVVKALKALGASMIEPNSEPEVNSPIPPIYTYWGQFIDHDMTANTDRDSKVSNITVSNLKPLDPKVIKGNLKNLRQPALNLDHVYGDGPFVQNDDSADNEFIPYDGIKLKLGNEGPLPAGTAIPRFDGMGRDLPRRQGDSDPRT